MPKQSYRDLEVWKQAVDLAVHVYRATAQFPPSERYGLQQQMRESAASVPANLAEGKGRGYSRDFHRFVCIARGSLAELETFIELSGRLGFLRSDTMAQLQARTSSVGRMTSGLAASLRKPRQ